MMRRSGQRRSSDHEEALAVRDGFKALELVGRHEAFDFMMFARRLEILSDGEEVDLRGAKIVHDLQDLVPLFTQTDHDAGLSEHHRLNLLDPLQQPQRMKIARTRSYG